MGSSPIPDDIRRYVIQCVPSVPYIEAVLLMRETRSTWQPEALARRLYLGEEDVQRLLVRLDGDGIVSAEADGVAGFRYSPVSEELDSLWGRLAVAYAQHLVEVSTLIHSKAGGKAQMLADAFVWRKGK